MREGRLQTSYLLWRFNPLTSPPFMHVAIPTAEIGQTAVL